MSFSPKRAEPMLELVPELAPEWHSAPSPATFLSELDAKNEPPLSVRLSRAMCIFRCGCIAPAFLRGTAAISQPPVLHGRHERRANRASLLLTRNFV
jgi:hypothetical protein